MNIPLSHPCRLAERRPPRRDAFTLIEVVSVVIVLATLAAIVLPQIGPHDDLKVAAAAREITADLLYAQSQAAATGQVQCVAFDLAAGKYSMLNPLNPPVIVRHPSLQSPYEMTLGSGPLAGVTIESADFDGSTTIAFDASAAPHAYAGEDANLRPLMRGAIVLRCGEARLTVRVEPLSGKITVQ